MGEREKILKRVQICDFALTDASLYLNIRPEDQKALAYYQKYAAMKSDAVKEYVEKYGPIQHSDYDGGERWKWVDGPWPWQTEEEEA